MRPRQHQLNAASTESETRMQRRGQTPSQRAAWLHSSPACGNTKLSVSSTEIAEVGPPRVSKSRDACPRHCTLTVCGRNTARNARNLNIVRCAWLLIAPFSYDPVFSRTSTFFAAASGRCLHLSVSGWCSHLLCSC